MHLLSSRHLERFIKANGHSDRPFLNDLTRCIAQVLACVRVEDTLVLGTTQGLATVRDGTVVTCEGLHTPVHLLQVPYTTLHYYGYTHDYIFPMCSTSPVSGCSSWARGVMGSSPSWSPSTPGPCCQAPGRWSLRQSRTSPGVTSSHAAKTPR